MAEAINIANYIINEYTKQDITITNLKLQKMLYYIQGYSLKKFNEKAFSSEIRNWPYGPVIPDVYFEFNGYRGNPIYLDQDFDIKSIAISGELKSIVDDIIDRCKDERAFDLVKKTHAEEPWKNTEQNEIITEKSMKEYFCANDPLGISEW
ncbi:MAG: DUF4065 domain-containing protein [Ruminococcus sp.]|nr:DUF4065 domain-containing protein [Ruminococcus sp.]